MPNCRGFVIRNPAAEPTRRSFVPARRATCRTGARRGRARRIIPYPVPSIRLVTSTSGGTTTTVASTLHRDALASVRGLTGPDGLRAERTTYRPFGEQDEFAFTLAANETKGFIGERYDADAGLQFLNARYYDPKLGLFLQPDWWEVTQAGVGTNRYAYAGNDPVYASDPGVNKSSGNNGEGAGSQAGDGWSSDRLERERNGWHDDCYDWSKGSENVKIGDTYVPYREYDRIVATIVAEGGNSFDRNLRTSTETTTAAIRTAVSSLAIMNPDWISRNPAMQRIIEDSGFLSFVVEALVRSNYLATDKELVREVTEHIFFSEAGSVRYKHFDVRDDATPTSTSMTQPRPLNGELGFTFHTHPYNGPPPGDVDIRTAGKFEAARLVATYRGEIWGYDENGYK